MMLVGLSVLCVNFECEGSTGDNEGVTQPHCQLSVQYIGPHQRSARRSGIAELENYVQKRRQNMNPIESVQKSHSISLLDAATVP